MTEIPTDLRPSVVHGNAAEVLRSFPERSVHCAVTSPPYFRQRLYGTTPVTWPDGWTGELGHEKEPERYADHLSYCLEPLRTRVLREDGTLWLNIGDGFSTHKAGVTDERRFRKSGLNARNRDQTGAIQAGSFDKRIPGYHEKDLLGTPWIVAKRLREDGWRLRADIVWFKPNPNRSQSYDRPTCAYEHIFLLAPEDGYYYDREGLRHEYSQETMPEIGEKYRGIATKAFKKYGAADASEAKRSMIKSLSRHAGSNLTDVWTIVTPNYRGEHFATFPEAIPHIATLLGTSDRGVCSGCGAPLARELLENPHGERKPFPSVPYEVPGWSGRPLVRPDPRLCRWTRTCACDDTGVAPAVVLDPFSGSGTTLRVARRLGRRSVGIELSGEYLPQILARSRADVPDLEAFAETQ